MARRHRDFDSTRPERSSPGFPPLHRPAPRALLSVSSSHKNPHVTEPQNTNTATVQAINLTLENGLDGVAGAIAVLMEGSNHIGAGPYQRYKDRDGQITLFARGQQTPFEQMKTWDADFAQRKTMMARFDQLIRQFSVRLGRTPSIDRREDVTEPLRKVGR